MASSGITVATHATRRIGGRRRDLGTLALVTLCVGTIASTGAFFLIAATERDQRRADFEITAHDRMDAIETRVKVTVSVLHAIAGLFAATNEVDRSAFRAFVRSLRLSSAVQAVEWIPRVPAERRTSFEDAARRGEFPDFKITERQAQGEMVRAAQRAEYFHVYYVEPYLGNEAALGYDLGSNPARLAALNSSRDAGEMVATSRITLVQETGDQYDFLVFVPIYRSGAPLGTVEGRREALLGFGLGVFRVGSLVEAALPGDRRADVEVRIGISDLSAPEGSQLLYPRSLQEEAGGGPASDLQTNRISQVAGRTWLISAWPGKASPLSATPWRPWATLTAGLLITLLLALQIEQLRRRAGEVEWLVQVRTGELTEANHALEAAQAQLQELAYSDPLTGLVNRQAFDDRRHQAVELAKRNDHSVYMLVMDLDGFKAVNDTRGHHAGDAILREIGRRLRSGLRKADTIARQGGDEFAVLAQGNLRLDDVLTLARKIGEEIERPIPLPDGGTVRMKVSIGIAAFPDHGHDADEILQHADLAMYRAKKNSILYAVHQPGNQVEAPFSEAGPSTATAGSR